MAGRAETQNPLSTLRVVLCTTTRWVAHWAGATSSPTSGLISFFSYLLPFSEKIQNPYPYPLVLLLLGVFSFCFLFFWFCCCCCCFPFPFFLFLFPSSAILRDDSEPLFSIIVHVRKKVSCTQNIFSWHKN